MPEMNIPRHVYWATHITYYVY